MDIDDRLEIVVRSGRDLPEAEGGECNPFALIICGKESETTNVANSTTNPDWNATRMIFVDIAENDVDHMLLRVMHKNLSGGPDTPLGQCIPGQKTPVGGRIKVEMSYFISDGDLDLPDGEDSDDDDEDTGPNMLVGTIFRAKGLYLEGKPFVDAYVTVRVGRKKAKTPVVKSNGPMYNFEFRLPVSSGEDDVVLKVKDKGVLSNQLVGECVLPMVEVASYGDTGRQKWCRLLGKHGLVDGESRGEVEVSLAWVYDRKYARSFARLMAAGGALVGAAGALFARKVQVAKEEKDEETGDGGENSWMMEEEAFVPIKLSSKQQEELEERREAGIMMADRKLDDIEKSQAGRMQPGDYQVQVHIIECRDLKGEDLNGLSDPYARVKVMNRPSKIAEANVEISIFDFDVFGAHDLIGLAAWNCGAIHALPDHEFYRKRPTTSTREYQEELDREMDDGGDAGGMALSGPDQESKLVFLVVYVWEAEDLPQMDASGMFTRGGIEAYVRVDFAGSKIRTSSISVTGKGNLAPEFREELWIPVSEPTEAARITVGLWDYNTFTRDRPVAHAYFDYSELKRNLEKPKSSMFGTAFGGVKYTGPRPRWHTLYGAPLGVQGKRGALQNRFGDEASTYRGRVLLSMEVMERPPRGERSVAHAKNFRFVAKEGLKPSRVKYHLRTLAVLGSEIPQFSVPMTGKTATMRLVVSIGNHRLAFGWKKNERGLVTWNELHTLRSVDLPVLIDELPDICIYLQRGPPKVMTICYCRVPAAKFLKAQFSGDPEWFQLRPDACRTRKMGGVDLAANPGAVLLKLGFGLSEDAVYPEFAWDEPGLLKKCTTVRPFTMRLYVYQARHLPPSDANGMLDPYVKVRFLGKKQKTAVHSMTTAPLFYETLQFTEYLPEDSAYAPDVVLQVWDADTFASNTPMAMLRLSLGAFAQLSSESSRPPTPKWRRLCDLNGEPIGGEILVAGALIFKRDVNEKTNKPESIVPQMRQAWVEVTCVGVRQLKTYRLRTPSEPYVRVDVPAPDDGGNNFSTRPSSRPSGRNANFIERKTMCLEMPENALFAQQMDLRVYNSMELFDDAAQRKREAAAEQAKAAEEARLAALEENEGDADNDGGAGAGSVGVTFGEGDAEDDDVSSLGDEVDQHELERFDEDNLPMGAGGADLGTGAFDPMSIHELPMVYEDILYMEEQERLLAEIAAEAKENEEGHGLLDMVEARLKNATDLGLDTDVQYKLSDLPISFPSQWAVAEYLNGREWWTNKDGLELEKFLKTKPFETYPVYRGKYHPNPSKSTLRSVGFFKGIIRVLDSDPSFEAEPFFPMAVLKPQQYICRLYAIRGANLQPVDGNSCDPYLRVKLGSEVDSRSDSKLLRTLKPDFYETFEFTTTLPGPAVLKIQVKDWNRFYPIHELVGETKIDLEDRWFHRDWQAIDELEPGTKNKLKPIEIRSLHKEGSHTAQGQVHMWLEIRPEREALREPRTVLEAPEKREFEVRVICWKTKDVPYESGDYYAEFQIGDSKKQCTDIHWRCRSGRASWNWRLKFPVELPLASPELGRLNVQLWDKDIIKWNDIIGQSQLDLYRWLLKAYRENRAVNVFTEINQAIERKKKEEMGIMDSDDEDDDDDDDDDDGSGSESGSEGDGGDGDGDGDGGGGGGGDGDGEEKPDGGDGGEETKEEGGDGDGAEAEGEKADGDGEAPKKKKKKKKKDDDDDDGDKKPLSEDEIAEKDAQFFVAQLKNLMGLGPLDASAQWLKMTYKDQKRHRVYHRGAIAISVEILPKEDAENRPAGHGIAEPNQNPTLPPRSGRLALSTDPFAILSELFGPQCMFIFCCCLCCVLVALLWFYLGMYYVNIYNMLRGLRHRRGQRDLTTTMKLGRLQLGSRPWHHGLLGASSLVFTFAALVTMRDGFLLLSMACTTPLALGSLALLTQAPQSTAIARGIVAPHREAYKRRSPSCST
ncbi:hypothetical protein JL720_7609 [Aureococcus anophagefferens]|nr:hypothetical protein JL720_7609 [Aureococcus anophagefferens]